MHEGAGGSGAGYMSAVGVFLSPRYWLGKGQRKEASCFFFTLCYQADEG